VGRECWDTDLRRSAPEREWAAVQLEKSLAPGLKALRRQGTGWRRVEAAVAEVRPAVRAGQAVALPVAQEEQRRERIHSHLRYALQQS